MRFFSMIDYTCVIISHLPLSFNWEHGIMGTCKGEFQNVTPGNCTLVNMTLHMKINKLFREGKSIVFKKKKKDMSNTNLRIF